MIMKKYFVSLFCIAAFCACTDQVNDFPAQPDRAQSKTINQAHLDQVTAQKSLPKHCLKLYPTALTYASFLKPKLWHNLTMIMTYSIRW